MKFSFALIARNEANTLPRLLESLEKFKDAGGEIVLLDTGSTDATVQIARNYGCKVEEVGEKYLHVIDAKMAHNINTRFVVYGEEPIVKEGDTYFDFGNARNHAASLASNDMVSFVDADEVLKALDFNAINSLIEQGYDQFEYAFVFAHDSEGRPAVEFVQSKFFDRRKMQWNGIIHEVLSGTGNRFFLSKEQFGLEHFQNEATNRKGYLTGLAVDCFEHPDNDRNSHYFARELMYRGQWRSAIQEFERHIEMKKWDAERAQSYIYMGDCEGKLNHPQAQAECYFEAFYICPHKREALIKLAYFFRANDKPQAVAAYAAAAMEIPWSGFYADNRRDYEDVPHALMYWAKGWLGDLEAAKHHLSEAMKYQPKNEEYIRDSTFYFKYPDNGIDGWMTLEELNWLFETAKGKEAILEIGSWKGRSTHALLTGQGGGTLWALDTWEGSLDPKDQTHGTDTFEEFKKNTAGFPALHVQRGKSPEAAYTFASNYDMIFIDAGHTYEEVKADIQEWRSHVRLGGILCGHDYSRVWPDVMKAVDEIFGSPDGVAGTIWYKKL